MSGQPSSRVTTLVEAAEKLSREVRGALDADASEGTPLCEWSPDELEVMSRVLLELCGPVDEAIDAVWSGPESEPDAAPADPAPLPPGQAARLAALLNVLDGIPISDAERRSLTWLAGDEPDTIQRIVGMISRARARSALLAMRAATTRLDDARDEVISRHREADRYRGQLVDLCSWAGIDPGQDPHAALLAHLRGREPGRGQS